MKFLFIRHGETTDNLRHVYAGVTDSALTAHGVLQTARLAAHLGTAIPPITHIYSSPLSRARGTAAAIRDEQRRRRRARADTSMTTPAAAAAGSGNGDIDTDTTLVDVAAPDVPENGGSSSSAASIPPVVGDDDDDDDDGILFTIDHDLIEQDFGSYEGEALLTATPRSGLKKRKRSIAEGTGSTNGDTKKRKPDGDGSAGSPTTTGASRPRRESVQSLTSTTTAAPAADVEMTAGPAGSVQVSTTLPPGEEPRQQQQQEATKVEEKEEEEEEEEFREMETPASIKARAESFVRRCIIPLLPNADPSTATTTDETTTQTPHSSNAVVAIVSHGMLLSWLWRAFVALFPPTSVLATTPVVQKGWYQGKHPGWGNTGYLVVEVLPAGVVAPTAGMTVVIEGVNEKVHLQGLRRTGGGIGSERFDQRQMKVDAFFKPGGESAGGGKA